MKKTLLIIAALLPILSQAQFNKGDKVLGGSLSLIFQNESTDEDEQSYRYSSFSLLPKIGVFVNEKLEVGGLLGYSSLYQKFEYPTYSSTYDSRSLSTGVYARQYFSLSDKFLFSFIAQSYFSRGFQKSPEYDPNTGEIVETKTKQYSINTSLRPTFHFFPSAQWGFELGLASLNHLYARNLSTERVTNQFSISYGSINLGVSYYFRKSGE